MRLTLPSSKASNSRGARDREERQAAGRLDRSHPIQLTLIDWVRVKWKIQVPSKLKTKKKIVKSKKGEKKEKELYFERLASWMLKEVRRANLTSNIKKIHGFLYPFSHFLFICPPILPFFF